MIQFIFTIPICLLVLYLWHRRGDKHLPPGPLRLPILGSAIQLHFANPTYPHLAMAKLSETYGSIMSFGFGMNTAVVVSSYEIMREVFKRPETNSHRFEFPYVPDRSYGKNLGILWSHGSIWNEVRRYTMKTLKDVGYGKSKTMHQSLAETADDLVKHVSRDVHDGIYDVDSHTFSTHMLNILWSMVGGYKFDPEDELLKRNLELGDRVVDIVGHGNFYNVWPFLKSVFQMKYKEHLEVHQEMQDFMKVLIQDAITKRQLRSNSEPTTFIEVFLDEIEKHAGEDDTIFTHEQLQLTLLDLFLAGSETTGTLLSWAVLYLVQNMDVQERVRQEIIEATGNNLNNLVPSDLKKMPFTRATVLEIYRLGNVVPIPLPRCPQEDIHVEGYVIPKGSVLFYNLHAMYHDKAYWTDPQNFRPQRFLTEDGEIDKPRADRILNSVFGVGTRVCFGESIAVDAFFMFLAHLVMNFEFDSIPGIEPSADNPDAGLCVCPRKYSVQVSHLRAS